MVKAYSTRITYAQPMQWDEWNNDSQKMIDYT